MAPSPAFSNSSSGVFPSSPLYSSPSLSINTQSNGNAMPSQLSPNTAAAFGLPSPQQPQQQQPQQQQQQGQQQHSPNGAGYGFGNNAYNMLGMGLPGMNMLNSFPYNGQMGNYGQVSLSFSTHSLLTPSKSSLCRTLTNSAFPPLI